MLKVNYVPIGSSPTVRRSRKARFKRAVRKHRPEAELLMGYNYSRGHIPSVPGAGGVRLNLFEQPGGSASRLPKRHLGRVVACFGPIIFFACFGLLLHPVGFALGGGLLVFFVLRGFMQSSTRTHLELSTDEEAVKG